MCSKRDHSGVAVRKYDYSGSRLSSSFCGIIPSSYPLKKLESIRRPDMLFVIGGLISYGLRAVVSCLACSGHEEMEEPRCEITHQELALFGILLIHLDSLLHSFGSAPAVDVHPALSGPLMFSRSSGTLPPNLFDGKIVIEWCGCPLALLSLRVPIRDYPLNSITSLKAECSSRACQDGLEGDNQKGRGLTELVIRMEDIENRRKWSSMIE